MKKITLLAASLLLLISAPSQATNLGDVTWYPGQVINSAPGLVYDIYGLYQNSATVNNWSTVTLMSGSSYVGHAGSMLNNYNGGSIHLASGSTTTYELGSGFKNYSGGLVTNDAAVINNGNLVFDAGSTVNGSGSYTQVNGGSLVVNGVFSQAGGIYITDHGYLGGSGTINGNVYASGADVIIAPGNSPGHITINGDLNGAKLVMQVYSLTEFDKISVTGNFDLGAARILFDVKPELKDTFLEHFNFSSFFEKIESPGVGHAPEISLFKAVTFEYGDANTEPGTGGNVIDIQELVSAVPEPDTYAMALAGL